jgi:two-component system, chemotaxis family, CheB/CheR fusion protein
MKSVSIKKPEEKKGKGLPVVAIGASAGGIEAMAELLKNLPADTGMSYIYIQHLDPDHESMLADILGRMTSMTVAEVQDKMKLRPDHVYIIPPNKNLTLDDGTLQLSLRPTRPERHLPINSFFASLAENYKERAIGVLLSGNPPDGTLGLKLIKAAGGITFAQDSTAKFAGMPRNAIAEEAVDLVLAPKRIAEELVKLSKEQERYQASVQALNEEIISDGDEHLIAILRQVHSLTGADFSQYKNNTIKRRIIRRMVIQKIETLEEYVQYLKHHANEVNQLYQDLLINVTSFFRDAEAMEYLKKSLLPRMLKIKNPSDPIRIWVPACSTGQEAYGLAIILMEVLGEKAATTNVQIFATDLSELAINKARLGIYSKDELSDVPTRRLERFFTKIDGSYRIIKSIRDLCVYATHNVLKDPPFSRLDIISCSNLLIYLEPVLQKKLMSTFHYALNNNGYLVLGKSETIGSSGNLFSQVDKKHKVYLKKKDAAAKALFELNYRSEGQKEDSFGKRPTASSKNKSDDLDLDKIVDELLLKKYTPACVVVNHDLDIVQFRGSTGLFLEPAPGRASLNLLKMARPGLGLELRNLVHKASKSGEAELKNWVETVEGNKTRKLSIEAVPIKHDVDSMERYFLVVFDEQELPATDTEKNLKKDHRVKQLEAELAQLREDMRSIVEEQEAANEELQSVNEEIVSSNEELQSINEELETSKEELESSNEELITVNQELQMRNEQLTEMQEYSEAVFTTIRESLLILDKNLRIKNVNSTFYRTFHVTEEEIEGKSLYDIGNKQWNIPRLKELLEEIIPRNSVINDFEVVHTFPYIGEKVMILNARRLIRKLHSEHLILLAFEDITEYRKAQKVLAEREEWFRNMADNSPMMVWVADAHKKMQFVNKAFLEIRNVTPDQVLGKSWIEDMNVEDKKRVKKIMEEAFQNKKDFSVQYSIKKGSGDLLLLSKGKPNYNHNGDFIGFIGSCVDVGNTEKE